LTLSGLVVAIFYGSILFCIVASVIKLIGYARFPIHLRWEIHKHSSAYEFEGWWKEQRLVQKGKFGGTVKDIAGLRGYYKNNRAFWVPLFPFHLGVYLLVLWHAWLFIYPLVFSQPWPVNYSLFWGHTATALMFFGAAGVLFSRLFSRALISAGLLGHPILAGTILNG
jgi:nitrate reductase gamma subunit